MDVDAHDRRSLAERTMRRLAWSLWIVGALCLALSIALDTAAHTVDLSEISQGAAFTAIGVVGLIVALRRPRNPIGWIYLGIWVNVGLLFGLIASWLHRAEPGALTTFLTWLTNWAWIIPFAALLTFPFLLFPDGHLPSPRWRPVAWGIAITIALWSIAVALEGHDYTDVSNRHIPNPYAPPGLVPFFDAARIWISFVMLGFIGATVASLVVRYRRSQGDEREQIRWLMLAGAVTLVWFGFPVEHGSGGLADAIQGFVLMLIPVSIGIAILKYRLYDIDVVIRRTIVVGVLAVFISGVYVAIVVGLGAIISESLGLRIAATALVAIAFEPVRTRANRFANRLVYGRRATPYEVLARFGERVGETYASDDVLPRIARVIAEGTTAERSEVWLRLGDELHLAASWPLDAEGTTVWPIDGETVPAIAGDHVAAVRHRGELLGAIAVTKPAAEPLTTGEAELVDRLADQAGLVLANARLTADLEARLDQIAVQAAELRASRQRIVAAQDEERRRLERNIHDGAQQHLVALAVKLRLAKAAIGADPQRGRLMLTEIRGEIDAALDTLRSLSLGIYPPLLEEQGLAAALAAQYVRSELPVRLEADGLGRHPIDIEAAVYFSALEALQNAAKYAGAASIVITLREQAGALAFTVADDGVGFDPAGTGKGTGLDGIRDRLAVFGGDATVASTPGQGTTVSGRVPVDGRSAP